MDRILFKHSNQRKFLDDVKKNSGLSLTQLAIICGINKKRIGDWHTEKATMLFDAARLLSDKFLVKIPEDHELVPEFWYTSKAGKLGGAERIQKAGNPGTAMGRKLGGIKSLTTHQKLKTAFKTRKTIHIPKTDKQVAELFGVIMGDGGITYHQLTISLNKKTDKKYAEWVTKELKDIFKIDISQKEKKNVLQIVASSINLIEFLLRNGLSRGNKIKNGVDIPHWIRADKTLEIPCIRGLIDTDGCIYFDKHKYKNKVYKNICLDFTSASPKLLNSVYTILTKLKLDPKVYGKSLKIRKLENIKRYFSLIGSHNPKHTNKFTNFINGEVA